MSITNRSVLCLLLAAGCIPPDLDIERSDQYKCAADADCLKGFECTDSLCRKKEDAGSVGCASSNGGCDVLTTCTDTANGTTCSACPTGYSGDGKSGCLDIDECMTNNGGCDALTLCTNTLGGNTCGACPSGYTGDAAQGCIDIDECTTNNGGCDALTVCTNTSGGKTCGACPSGYTGDGNTGCADINECLTNNGGCHPSATCANNDGGRDCTCTLPLIGDGVICGPDWGTPEYIGHDETDIVNKSNFAVKLAVDDAGNAVHIYYDGGSGSGVYARRYNATADAWESLYTISPTGVNPLIAMDGAGNAIAAWYSNSDLHARVFSVSAGWPAGWGVDEVIGTTTEGALFISSLAATASGYFNVAWYIWAWKTDSRYEMFSRLYDPALGNWRATATISPVITGSSPSSDIYDPGSATVYVVAAWGQSNEAFANVYSYDTVAGTGSWGTPASLESAAGSSRRLAVTMDGAGGAVAIWSQEFAGERHITANYLSSLTGSWQSHVDVSPPSVLYAYIQDVSRGPAGQVVVAWREFGAGSYTTWVRRHTSNGWQTSARILDANDADEIAVAFGADGNGVVIWSSVVRTQVWASSYFQGYGYQSAVQLRQDVAHSHQQLDVQLTNGREGVAVWMRELDGGGGNLDRKIMGITYH